MATSENEERRLKAERQEQDRQKDRQEQDRQKKEQQRQVTMKNSILNPNSPLGRASHALNGIYPGSVVPNGSPASPSPSAASGAPTPFSIKPKPPL